MTQTEAYMSVLATLITAGWAILKSTAWWQEHVVKPRYDAAADAVAVGVAETYDAFVREKKATGTKISIETGAAARIMAAEIARAYAAKQGPKVLKILTDEYLLRHIERAVQ